MEHRSKSRELPEGMFLADDEEPPRVGLDRHRIDDEIYQHVPENRAEWAEYVMAEDGMPKPKVPTQMPYAPPLHPDTLCCIADTRSFVLRGKWGDILAEFAPHEVERTIGGKWRVSAIAAGRALGNHVLDEMGGLPDETTWAQLIWRVTVSLGKGLWRQHTCPLIRASKWDWYVEVEPVRPQCKHFARQMSDFQDLSDHAFLARLCTARRDDGGEFLGLRDEQMFACDMRDPFDLKGAARADKFDENKIILGRERFKRGEVWDVDAALDGAVSEAQGDPAATSGGIFRKGSG